MTFPIPPIAIPVGDSPNVRAVRAATWALLSLHVLVFLFGSGYRPGSPLVYKLFTSLFLSAGVLATGFPLLLLWIVGDNVEHHIGRLPFLGLYVGGGARMDGWACTCP